MSASVQFDKYTIAASAAVMEELSERIRQLTHRIRAMRQQLQSLLANVPEQSLRVLRQRIQVHQQEILRLEQVISHNRDQREQPFDVMSLIQRS